MQRIQCKEEEKSTALIEEGYAIFQLLTPEHITYLTKIFYDHHEQEPDGFYASTHIQDKVLRKTLSDHIRKVIASVAPSIFLNIEVLGGAFIAKAPGNKGILPLHQDWNIVDEKQARSYNLWIPLVDVSPQNGTMKILPKSHIKQENYRGPGIPSLFQNITEVVDEHMLSLNMKAGEALLYDHALWHSSPKNNTDQLRLCVVLGAIPKNTPLKYYAPKENKIAEFNSNVDFFFDHDYDQGANHLEFNQFVTHDTEPCTRDAFLEKYIGISASAKPKKKKWFNLFSRKQK